MLPFILLVAVLPGVSLAVAQFVTSDIGSFIASYMPTFSPETALYSLGNVSPISVYGLIRNMGLPIEAVPGKNAIVMMAITLVLGILFMILGERVNKRRDM